MMRKTEKSTMRAGMPMANARMARGTISASVAGSSWRCRRTPTYSAPPSTNAIAAKIILPIAPSSPSSASPSSPLRRALGLEALERHLRVVGKRHGRRQRAVPGPLGDQAVHRLRDAPVGRVALRGAAQLDEVHRLARVHLYVETDAVGHGHRVGGHLGQARGRDGVVQ